MREDGSLKVTQVLGLGALYGVLFRPGETFDAMADEVSLGLALFVLAGLAVVLAFAVAPAGVSALLLTWGVLTGWLVFLWVLLSGLVYVAGSILGGRGALSGVMGALAYAFLPLMLLAPIGAWSGMGGSDTGIGVATLGVLLWWGRALHAAVCGSLRLSGTQATFALLGAELAVVGIPATYVSLIAITALLALL